MKRTPIQADPDLFPPRFHHLLAGAPLFDSSCSPEARVYYIEKEGGLFLKSAPKGALRAEAELTRYFHGKGLSAQVLAYESLDRDWLLTRRVPGEDCLNERYLAQPERLCDTAAELLRMLHSTPAADCPVCRTPERLRHARENFRVRHYDDSRFPDSWGFSSAEEAWALLDRNKDSLRSDVLIHGDYCLPNLMLDGWRFSGFIDVGGGGLGDRHMDLFWGIWSLEFNLKTNRYNERFLDAYGRDDVEPEMLRTVAALEVFG